MIAIALPVTHFSSIITCLGIFQHVYFRFLFTFLDFAIYFRFRDCDWQTLKRLILPLDIYFLDMEYFHDTSYSVISLAYSIFQPFPRFGPLASFVLLFTITMYFQQYTLTWWMPSLFSQAFSRHYAAFSPSGPSCQLLLLYFYHGFWWFLILRLLILILFLFVW